MRPNGPNVWRRIHMITGHQRDVVIAGGCVRDYLLNFEPKDIDVFVGPDFDYTSISRVTRERPLGIARNAEYSAVGDIISVRYFEFMGTEMVTIILNIVQLSTSPRDLQFIKNFDFTVNQCWWDNERHRICLTDQAEVDLSGKFFRYVNEPVNRDREARGSNKFTRFGWRTPAHGLFAYVTPNVI